MGAEQEKQKPKLRLVFYEDKEGKALSYFYLERSEAMRVIKILKVLPKLKGWTPVSQVARQIEAKLPATLWVVQKLAGALYLDLMVSDKRKVVAKRPVLLVRKEQYNSRNNFRRQKFLKAGVFVRGIFSFAQIQ